MDYVNLSTANLLTVDADAVNNLKEKIICEYTSLLNSVERGYKLDYQMILEEIILIDLIENYNIDARLALFVLQFYLNNKWQITIS